MNPFMTYTKYGNETIVRSVCFSCGEITELRVPTSHFEKYLKGMFVQDAFPYLSVVDRETIVSGMCESCQDKFFEGGVENEY